MHDSFPKIPTGIWVKPHFSTSMSSADGSFFPTFLNICVETASIGSDSYITLHPRKILILCTWLGGLSASPTDRARTFHYEDPNTVIKGRESSELLPTNHAQISVVNFQRPDGVRKTCTALPSARLGQFFLLDKALALFP